jgi:porin
LNWTGPFASRKADVAGIAVAYAHISGSQLQLGQDRIAFTGTGSPFRGNETVIEATYQYQVAPWWMMQPDLQYVINPGIGIPNPANGNRQVPLKNAWVIGVRATITF